MKYRVFWHPHAESQLQKILSDEVFKLGFSPLPAPLTTVFLPRPSTLASRVSKLYG